VPIGAVEQIDALGHDSVEAGWVRAG